MGGFSQPQQGHQQGGAAAAGGPPAETCTDLAKVCMYDCCITEYGAFVDMTLSQRYEFARHVGVVRLLTWTDPVLARSLTIVYSQGGASCFASLVAARQASFCPVFSRFVPPFLSIPSIVSDVRCAVFVSPLCVYLSVRLPYSPASAPVLLHVLVQFPPSLFAQNSLLLTSVRVSPLLIVG